MMTTLGSWEGGTRCNGRHFMNGVSGYIPNLWIWRWGLEEVTYLFA
jgi:hypothetical protein